MNTTTVTPSTEILSAFTSGQKVEIVTQGGVSNVGYINWANAGGFMVTVAGKGRCKAVAYTVSADMQSGVEGGAKTLRMWNAARSRAVTSITIL